jgi:hypothetical protein
MGCVLLRTVARRMGNATHRPAVRQVREPACTRSRDLAGAYGLEAPRPDTPRRHAQALVSLSQESLRIGHNDDVAVLEARVKHWTL